MAGMRIESVPFILAGVFGLVALGLIADAWLPDQFYVPSERRRRRRAERHRGGEGLVGVGILALAAALAGRDTWRYGTVAVILGTLLLAAGAVLNRRYLKELYAFRGPARRVEVTPPSPADEPASRPPGPR